MGKWFLILLMMSSFIIFHSCNTEKENVDQKEEHKEQKIIINEPEHPSPWIYEDGDLYCVIGDTVMIFDRLDGKISYESWPRTLSYRFGLAFVFRNKKPDNDENYSKFIEYLQLDSNQHSHFSAECITVGNPFFYVYDERNKPVFAGLFDTRSDLKIPVRHSYEEEEYEWRRNNREVISDWEKNAIEEMTTSIFYLDMNKSVCRLSSGYKGHFANGPKISYPFKNRLVLTIDVMDTILTLGYPDVKSREINSITIVDTRKYKRFDYICVTYNGLKALATDLQKTIKPTQYPIILTLEKMQSSN